MIFGYSSPHCEMYYGFNNAELFRMASEDKLVTIGDLNTFKAEVLQAIRQLVDYKPAVAKKWLKSSEVRKLIGVSPGKLQTIRKTGLLTFTKIGGNIYYDHDELMQLFENNKVLPKP